MSIGTDKDSQKKMIGELLKAADRFIKSSEWSKALDEVGKALAIEPNNMYAMAYKDRINVSIAEDKKKAEDEKVKRLAEEKKGQEKPAEAAPEAKKPESPKAPEPAKVPEPPKTEEKRPEPPKAETKPVPPPAPAAAPPKEDAAARVESLRQEFSAIQAKLQREVAQLTMQVREAQALKEATEKNLNAQIVALTAELNALKQTAGKSDPKELDALKAKHQKELESAREITKAEMLTQVAVLQKEVEASRSAADGSSLKKHGEIILRDMFQKAWQDGVITNDERALLLLLKGAIEMTEAKFGEMESSTRADAYVNALRTVWSDGAVTPEESDFLTSLREKLGIQADEHFRLEGQIRKEVKK